MKQKIIDKEFHWFGKDSEGNQIDFIQSNFPSRDKDAVIKGTFEIEMPKFWGKGTLQYETNASTERLHPKSKTDIVD